MEFLLKFLNFSENCFFGGRKSVQFCTIEHICEAVFYAPWKFGDDEDFDKIHIICSSERIVVKLGLSYAEFFSFRNYWRMNKSLNFLAEIGEFIGVSRFEWVFEDFVKAI